MSEYHTREELADREEMMGNWADLRDAAALELEIFPHEQRRIIKDETKRVLNSFLENHPSARAKQRDLDNVLDEAIFSDPNGVLWYRTHFYEESQSHDMDLIWEGFELHHREKGFPDLNVVAAGVSSVEQLRELYKYKLTDNVEVGLDSFFDGNIDQELEQVRLQIFILLTIHEVLHYLIPTDAALKLKETIIDFYLTEAVVKEHQTGLGTEIETSAPFFISKLKELKINDADIQKILRGAPFIGGIFTVVDGDDKTVRLKIDAFLIFFAANYPGINEERLERIQNFVPLVKKYGEDLLRYLTGDKHAVEINEVIALESHLKRFFAS